MPIRVKPAEGQATRFLIRRDESLNSTDNLVAAYSLESLDPSYDAAATEFIMENKSPWAVCFPPRLQANMERMMSNKLDQLHLDDPSKKVAMGQHTRAQANMNSMVRQNGKQRGRRKSKNRHIHNGPSFGSEGTHETKYFLQIEQTDNLHFADDDSACSWASQNAVKFNKKLRPKSAADAHRVKEARAASGRKRITDEDLALVDRWSNREEMPMDSLCLDNYSIRSIRKLTDTIPEAIESNSLLSEKRDDEVDTVEETITKQVRHEQDVSKDDADEVGGYAEVVKNEVVQVAARPLKSSLFGTTKQYCKKSVCFTKPLVTSQYFRPKTRPEDVSLLYFDEDELEILEEDRETTSRDQFEMIAQELSENRLRISIAYQNRWRGSRRSSSLQSAASSAASMSVVMSSSDC